MGFSEIRAVSLRRSLSHGPMCRNGERRAPWMAVPADEGHGRAHPGTWAARIAIGPRRGSPGTQGGGAVRAAVPRRGAASRRVGRVRRDADAAVRERQANLEDRAALRGCWTPSDVRCGSRRSSARRRVPAPFPSDFVVKNGWKILSMRRGSIPGPVVRDSQQLDRGREIHVPFDHDPRRRRRARRTPRWRCGTGSRGPGAATIRRRARGRTSRRRRACPRDARLRWRTRRARGPTTCDMSTATGVRFTGRAKLRKLVTSWARALGLLPERRDVARLRGGKRARVQKAAYP